MLVSVLQRRDIFMEKHWRSAVNKSICDYFFEAQAKASSPEDIPPVITTPHYYLVSVYRNKVYFVAVIQNEGKLVNGGAVVGSVLLLVHIYIHTQQGFGLVMVCALQQRQSNGDTKCLGCIAVFIV